jgi:hypothetical protein
MPPGSAIPSSLAATLTPSPRMSPPSIRMSPVNPDPKQHTPVLRDTFVPLGHHRLHGYCALDRIDHRGKLKEHAVPRGLHEPTAVFCHEGVSNLAMFAECAGRADLVEAHEPRVARHVSRDYGRQSASDPSWLLLLHGQAAQAAPSVPGCRLPPVWAWGRASSTNGTNSRPGVSSAVTRIGRPNVRTSEVG